ncbi:MAG: exosortase-associated EpsI family protein [Pirellulales bacterium]
MRYLPYILAVVALVGFTAYQGVVTDRWRDNVEAEACAELLEMVPKQIGADWVGEDKEVPDFILDTAGAKGYVSRTYKNSRTKETVDVWFIVGHSFNIWRHTPNICYKAQGFTQQSPQDNYEIQVKGQEPANFFTSTFNKGPYAERVFWTWSTPVTEPGQPVEWIAPENARGHFGNMRALYKLYFTSGVKENEKPEESVCVRFAEEFLPVANKILEQGTPPVTADAPVAAPATASPAAAAG